MSNIVRAALVQCRCELPGTESVARLKAHMLEKNEALVRSAAAKGAQIVCLQELFAGPYFAAEQTLKWYDMAEAILGEPGPTVARMMALARELKMAVIAPVMERTLPGVY